MTPEPGDLREEITDVARRIEGLAAARTGPLKITLDLCVCRLHVALILGERLRKASNAASG